MRELRKPRKTRRSVTVVQAYARGYQLQLRLLTTERQEGPRERVSLGPSIFRSSLDDYAVDTRLKSSTPGPNTALLLTERDVLDGRMCQHQSKRSLRARTMPDAVCWRTPGRSVQTKKGLSSFGIHHSELQTRSWH